MKRAEFTKAHINRKSTEREDDDLSLAERVYKRLRERNISERSIWYAIRNATTCIAYVPDRTPLAGGTCWRITGPDAEGEVTWVGVETFVDHLGRRLLVITVF